jgi:hypothetical protein
MAIQTYDSLAFKIDEASAIALLLTKPAQLKN